MSLIRYFAVALGAVLALGAVPAETHAQFGGLTGRVPNDANAIVILNAEQIKSSPLAVKENWRQDLEKAHASGLTILPPTASAFLMAAKLDFEFMRPIWELSLADLSYDVSMPKVAARWGGEVDRIDDRNAARLPDDSYVVQITKNRVGAMRPANRQSVGRWLRSTDNTKGRHLAPYLVEAVNYAEKGKTPMIMAMDMENVISPPGIRERVSKLETLKNSSLKMEDVVETLSSLRGVTLGITITDHLHGAILVDFDKDVSLLKDVAKPLLLEILANNSATIDEFSDWQATVSGRRIKLSGRLYRSGLQRILSVLDTPGSLHQMRPSSDEVDEDSAIRLASQQYFKSVGGYVDDLKARPKKSKVRTITQFGLWFDRYAEKIDSLPMLDVDPEMLDYGQYVSTSFRDAGEALRSVGGKKRVRQMNAPSQYNYYGRWGASGWYGGAVGGYSVAAVEDVRAEAGNRARMATEERVKGANSARQIMQDVANATAAIRRNMTQKYKAEF